MLPAWTVPRRLTSRCEMSDLAHCSGALPVPTRRTPWTQLELVGRHRHRPGLRGRTLSTQARLPGLSFLATCAAPRFQDTIAAREPQTPKAEARPLILGRWGHRVRPTVHMRLRAGRNQGCSRGQLACIESEDCASCSSDGEAREHVQPHVAVAKRRVLHAQRTANVAAEWDRLPFRPFRLSHELGTVTHSNSATRTHEGPGQIAQARAARARVCWMPPQGSSWAPSVSLTRQALPHRPSERWEMPL